MATDKLGELFETENSVKSVGGLKKLLEAIPDEWKVMSGESAPSKYCISFLENPRVEGKYRKVIHVYPDFNDMQIIADKGAAQ